MAAQLLMVNPRHKRKTKTKTTSRRRRASRAVNPRRRRVSARKRRAVATVTVRARNPRRVGHRKVHRAHRRRHANPRMLGLNMGSLTRALIPAAVGGAGAVALDVALGYLPASTPDILKTGIGNKALKVAGAIGLGLIAGKVLGKETGKAVGAGALTVVAYGIVREIVQKVAPSVTLSGTDYADTVYQPSASLIGAYMENGVNSFQSAQMGAYMNDGM